MSKGMTIYVAVCLILALIVLIWDHRDKKKLEWRLHQIELNVSQARLELDIHKETLRDLLRLSGGEKWKNTESHTQKTQNSSKTEN